jgi:hypothetical protein
VRPRLVGVDRARDALELVGVALRVGVEHFIALGAGAHEQLELRVEMLDRRIAREIAVE